MKVSNNSCMIPIEVGEEPDGGEDRFFMVTALKVVKEEDDPIALRVSWGWMKPQGFYFVFRGNLDQIKDLLRKCLDGIENLKEENFR